MTTKYIRLLRSSADGWDSWGLLAPLGDLLKGLGERIDDGGGFAWAEALEGDVGGLVGFFGCVPEADDDAVVREVGADALADGSCLGEGEGW